MELRAPSEGTRLFLILGWFVFLVTKGVSLRSVGNKGGSVGGGKGLKGGGPGLQLPPHARRHEDRRVLRSGPPGAPPGQRTYGKYANSNLTCTNRGCSCFPLYLNSNKNKYRHQFQSDTDADGGLRVRF